MDVMPYERLVEARSLKLTVAGPNARAIILHAAEICDGDEARAMLELVNAVSLAAVQIGQTLGEVVDVLNVLMPPTQAILAGHVSGEAPSFDA